MAEFKAQDNVAGHSYQNEKDEQTDDGHVVGTLTEVKLFQKLLSVAKMAVGLRAGQRRAIEPVRGHHGALEGVAEETDVGDPRHVRRNGVEVDEEAGEEQERNGAGRCHENGHLDAESRPD